MPEPAKKQELLIIKRTRGGHSYHHGGAWKIAFADFMTAMMALFLVLWLINATNEKTKASIARYFNPVDLVDMSTMKRGIHDPNAGTQIDGKNDVLAKFARGSDFDQPGAAQDSRPSQARGSSAEPPPTYSEAALFRDPYAVLAEIAATSETGMPASDQLPGGTATGDADTYKDPFKMQSAGPSPGAPRGPGPAPSPPPGKSGPQNSLAAVAPASAPAQNPLAQSPPNPPAKAVPTQQVESGMTEAARLKSEIAKLVGGAGKSQPAPNIEVESTDEGILIQLTDQDNFAMFAIGSAEPQPKTVKVMEKIAQILKSEKGTIVISGHTDGRPYRSATYDNWRLSAARAQMAYYMLVRGGLDEKRVQRIEGYADRKLKIPKNPLADENRRIEIFLQKDKS